MDNVEKYYSKIKYDLGTILYDESTKEAFEVVKISSMYLMTGGEKNGYAITVKKVKVKNA